MTLRVESLNKQVVASQMKLGAILSYASIAVNLIVGLTYTPFMLRMMGPSEYGLYSLAASIIAYLTVLDLGFGNAIIRYTAKYRAEGKVDEQQRLFGMFIMLYTLIALVTFFIGSGIVVGAEGIFGENMSDTEVYRTKIILTLLTFNVAVTFPLSIWGSIMSAYERFVFPKAVSIVRSILNALVMVVLLLYGYRAIAMVVVTTIFNISALLLNWIYCKKELSIKVKFSKFDWSLLKEVAIYSFWIFLNVLMDKVYWSTGQIVLGANSGTTAISVFAIAVQLMSYFMLLNVAISNMLLPRFTAMVVKGIESEISDFFVKVSRLQYFLIALVLSGFILFGKRFVILWAGAGYEQSYYISLALMIPMSIDILFSSCVKVLQAKNQMIYRSVVCVISALVCLLLQIPMSKYFGAIGCAFAIVIVFTIQLALLSFYYQRVQHLNIIAMFKNLAQLSIMPIALCLLYFGIRQLYANDSVYVYVSSIAIYSVLYGVLSYRFVMSNYEKGLVAPILKKIRMIK